MPRKKRGKAPHHIHIPTPRLSGWPMVHEPCRVAAQRHPKCHVAMLGVAPLHRAMPHAMCEAGLHTGATIPRTFHHLLGPFCYLVGAAASSPPHRAGLRMGFWKVCLWQLPYSSKQALCRQNPTLQGRPDLEIPPHHSLLLFLTQQS